MVSWFVPQNQVGYGLSVTPQNRREDLSESGLFHLEASWARVSSLASRLEEARRRWCTWHHHGGCVEMKPKMDKSMREDVVAISTSCRCLILSI
jgi:hypothetical protein